MRKRKLWLSAILIMMVICWFSSIPNLTLFDSRALSPETRQFIKTHTYYIGGKGFFSYIISPHPDYIAHKLGHIFSYGALGVSLLYALGESRNLAVLLTALFAAGDEFHQYFVAGRSSRFGDILLDTLSAILFILIVRKIEWRLISCRRFGRD